MLIYLHIPFCHRVCPYCSFYKHTPGKTPIGRFVDALVLEAKARITEQAKLRPSSPPRTLYLGGGTPSMLSPSHLSRLFEGLSECLDFDTLDEVTLEANPATFDQKKVELFMELGVRRISLGIQSFHQPTLERLGREHTPQQAIDSVGVLQKAGMPSINIDLMFSIPGLDLEAWRSTLETTIVLEPNHVSAYNLTYEEDTEFFNQLKEGNLDTNPDRDASQFFLGDELLTAAGFDHYETSNYATPGHPSSHNRGYWEGEDYLGLGPSSVSTLGSIRSQNVSDTDQYIRMIEGIGHASRETETLGPEEFRLERIALLLRTKTGISLDEFDSDKVAALIADGLAAKQENRLVLTKEGSALVDAIVTELI